MLRSLCLFLFFLIDTLDGSTAVFFVLLCYTILSKHLYSFVLHQ